MKPRRFAFALAFVAAAVLAMPAAAQSVEDMEQRVTKKVLDNGLTVLVVERPVAPVVSFFTHVDVGGAQEVPGITGLAHMFEHMAFKGTTRIGTRDAKKEQKALEAVDEAYAALARERRSLEPDPETIAELEAAFEAAQEAAAEFVVANEFDEIVQRAGGTGLNAFTNADSTGYMFSLPANKIELWAYLESERFRDPVFREYYKERDVVMEERRLRVDSNPLGRLIEQLGTTAFTAHPYKQPVVGYMSDLESITRQDAFEFYAKHYVPANMTVAVVGDVDPDAVLPTVEKYFGRLSPGVPPEPLRTVEPKSIAEKRVVIRDPSQPAYVEAYHRPSARHPDDAVYDAIADLLSNGRTSRLYKRLVIEEKIASFAGVFAAYPGTKYPSLMLFFALPSPDADNDAVRTSIREEIERLKTEPVSEDELEGVRTRAKAGLVRGLGSNMGLAQQLAIYEAQYGDWRELFRSVDRIEKVTAEDIERVANDVFRPENRTVAEIVPETAEGGE